MEGQHSKQHSMGLQVPTKEGTLAPRFAGKHLDASFFFE